MGPRLVEYLLYEPEDSGILWIKFNRPERMNALVGTAEENGTVAKVGEYMRAGDDDPNVRVIVLTAWAGFCSGAISHQGDAGCLAKLRQPLRMGARRRASALLPGFTALHRDIS
jgi:enoyl-CoA hydratase/carnithine racemase